MAFFWGFCKYGELFWVEVIAGHKANSAFKAQNADVSPGDIAVFAI